MKHRVLAWLNMLRVFRYLVVVGVIVHLLVWGAIIWAIERHGVSGLLPDSDEVRYIQVGYGLAEKWHEGIGIQYADFHAGDPHPGYYYVVAGLQYLHLGSPPLLRLLNVVIGLVAILLWWRALQQHGEPGAINKCFLLLALFTPSLMFWSALLLKEAWVYALMGGGVWIMAKILSTPGIRWQQLASLIGLTLVLGYFRAYLAVALLVIALAFLTGKVSRRIIFLLVVGLAAAVLFNPPCMDFVAGYVGKINTSLSVGKAAIDGTLPWWHKLWLYFTYPLPWQARSSFQKLAVPEVLVSLALFPAMVYGAIQKVRQNDLFAQFLLVVAIFMVIFNLILVGNLGTLFRTKSALAPIFIYFISVGIVSVRARVYGQHSSGNRGCENDL